MTNGTAPIVGSVFAVAIIAVGSFTADSAAAHLRPSHSTDEPGKAHLMAADPNPAWPVSGREFRKIKLTGEFWSEGVAFGDFNQDGHNDIVSGPYWYEGPDFARRHEFRPARRAKFLKIKADIKGDGHVDQLVYSDTFFAFVYDFNGDGWPDILQIGLPYKEAFWYENPGKAALGRGTPWRRHTAFDVVMNESPVLADLFGAGWPVLLCISGNTMGYLTADRRHPQRKWTFHPISGPLTGPPSNHGLGYGDVNGDGRADVLGALGWWEQPESLVGDPQWVFHRWSFLEKSPKPEAAFSSTVVSPRKNGDEGHWPYVLAGAQIYTYDVNGDGLTDVISSLDAHGYGLAWFEQLTTRDDKGEIQFKTHLIMSDRPESTTSLTVCFSQLHALALADVDGDGLLDIITGKRFWAHGRYGDPEPNAPAVLYWFQLRRTTDGNVEFVPHLIDEDSGVGTQVIAGDIQGDGLTDILTANKKGTFLFLRTPSQRQ